MRVWSLTYLAFLAALAAQTGVAASQTADSLRPAELDDPVSGDVLSTQDEAAQAATMAVPPPPPPEPAPPIRRRTIAEGDPYAPEGIAAGAFRFFPTVQAGGVISSNPEQKNSGGDAAFGLRLAPSFRLESDWVRHSLRLSGAGEFIDYPGSGIATESSGNIRAEARIDIRRSTSLDLDAHYDIDQTGASDSEVPDAATGSRVEHEIGGSAALSHQFGRLGLTARGGVRLKLYDDVALSGGGREDNSDRNFVEPEIALRAGYETSPALRPFAELAYAPRFHSQTPDRNGLDRDSNGYTIRAGAQIGASPLWSGELALAYQLRDYDDPTLKTISALGLIGDLVWRPTEMTTVTLTANTGIDETVTTGSSGTRVYSGRLDIEHLLRENIALRAGSGVEFDRRTGPDELTTDANLGVTYRFNPWVAWTADYDFTYFDSESPASDYVEHRFSTGIELRR